MAQQAETTVAERSLTNKLIKASPVSQIIWSIHHLCLRPSGQYVTAISEHLTNSTSSLSDQHFTSISGHPISTSSLSHIIGTICHLYLSSSYPCVTYIFNHLINTSPVSQIIWQIGQLHLSQISMLLPFKITWSTRHHSLTSSNQCFTSVWAQIIWSISQINVLSLFQINMLSLSQIV